MGSEQQLPPCLLLTSHDGDVSLTMTWQESCSWRSSVLCPMRPRLSRVESLVSRDDLLQHSRLFLYCFPAHNIFYCSSNNNNKDQQ